MKGSYILLLELSDDKNIEIGKLGNIFFKKGFYVYVGSALNNLEKRIERHLRDDKKLYWHVDFFLKEANVVDVFYKESTIREECDIASQLLGEIGFVRGFGCTDCSCSSHLFFGSKNDVLKAVNLLKMDPFFIK